MRRRLVAICAGVVAASAAGCGDDARRDGGVAPSAAASAPAASAPIAISTPPDGSLLRASRMPAGRLRVRTRVRGTTSAGGPVFLGASCRPVRCVAKATAGEDGGWAVPMTLTTTRGARFVTIDASSQASASSTGSAVTTVELLAPATARSTAGTTSRRRAAPPPAEPPPKLPHEVLVIGDSLAVGMADALRAALPGWQVRTDAKISRPLAEGMRILAAEPDVPAIVAFSLFTNDDPGATAALERAVRATATRPGGCVVWATIVRPPDNGVSYDTANRLLERLASDPQLRLRLVDWAGLVARWPSYVAGDGVHGTPESYRVRGGLYAKAIRSCAGEP